MGIFRNRKEAMSAIKRREKVVRGKTYVTYESYLGVDPVTREPRRLWDSDRKRLEAKIAEFYASMRANGAASHVLSFQQVMDAKAAYDLVLEKKLGMTLIQIVNEYCAGRAAKVEEAECVKQVKVSDAYAEYLLTFSDIQELHIITVRRTVGRWVFSLPEGTMFSSVTHDSIMAYLDSHRNWAPKSWNNAMLYIKTFLAWCASPLRQYAKENPLALAKKKTIAWHEPNYMAYADVERLARLVEADKHSHPDELVLFTLWFFCGMRIAEIERMANDPDAVRINLEDETIRVGKPKGYQKGIRPRSFHINPCALAWLKSADIQRGIPLITEKTRRRIGDKASANGIKVPDNAGRHTFITYHVAAYGEPAKTEGMVGTSANMRCQNYMGLEAKKNGLAYFEIMPR